MSTPPAGLAAALADRYRLEREIGEGGMATVYLAQDLRHDRQVAIKVLRPELAAYLGPQRFATEIRTTAKLRHPHILPLFDSGEVAVGRSDLLYFVMPYVEGESLRARLDREGQLPLDEALRIAREIGDGLAYAHAHGVIHRDIKPENVLLEGGHALIADFGIARAGTGAGEARITQTGLSVGTPAYMSPEQAAGATELDGRSDLYALASVLYEMLAGETPFTGGTLEAIVVQRFTQSPPKVSGKRPGVPRPIETAISRALARAPADRFPTVERFIAALREEPAAREEDSAASIAVLPFDNMSGDPENEYFSDGIAEEIINALTQLPGLRVAARTSAFSFKGRKVDLRLIGEQLNVGTVLEGSVRRAAARLRNTAQRGHLADGYHLWSERYDRELTDVFAIQDEIAAAIAAKLQVTLGVHTPGGLVTAPTENIEAYDHYLKGHALLNARGPGLLRAAELFEQAIALDPKFAAALAELAETLTLSGLYGLLPPPEVRARAGDISSRALESAPGLARAHMAQGLYSFMVEFDREKAARALSRSVELEPSNAEIRCTRAIVELTYIRGAHARAEAELRAAIELDPLSAVAQSQLSMALGWSARFTDAAAEAERAIALDPIAFYPSWALLLALALGAGPERAIQLGPALFARFGRHPWMMMAVGRAHAAMGRQELAEALYAEIEARARSEYVQPTLRAVLALAAGRRDEGFRHLRTAVEIRDPLFAVGARYWPALAAVRQDPEYQNLLQQLGWDTPMPEPTDDLPF